MSLAKSCGQMLCSLLLFSGQVNHSSAMTADHIVSSVNDTIEQSYHQIIDAYASLDAANMTRTYTSDGYYISTGKTNSIVHGARQIHALYQHYFEKIKNNNFKLAIQFRVIDRLVDTTSITDVGYYLVSVIPSQENNQPVKQHAGKYLITFKKDVNNQWRIWSDANNRVTIDEFNNTKKVDDLFYSAHQSLPPIVPSTPSDKPPPLSKNP